MWQLVSHGAGRGFWPPGRLISPCSGDARLSFAEDFGGSMVAHLGRQGTASGWGALWSPWLTGRLSLTPAGPGFGSSAMCVENDRPSFSCSHQQRSGYALAALTVPCAFWDISDSVCRSEHCAQLPSCRHECTCCLVHMGAVPQASPPQSICPGQPLAVSLAVPTESQRGSFLSRG